MNTGGPKSDDLSQTFIEHFRRTLLNEHLRVKDRITWCETVEEMQRDLEVYLESYNLKHPHCGCTMDRRALYLMLKAGFKDAKKLFIFVLS